MGGDAMGDPKGAGSAAVAAQGCISANVGGAGEAGAGMMNGKVIANGFVMSGLLPGGPAGQSYSSEVGAIVVSGLPADMEEIDLYRICAVRFDRAEGRLRGHERGWLMQRLWHCEFHGSGSGTECDSDMPWHSVA